MSIEWRSGSTAPLITLTTPSKLPFQWNMLTVSMAKSFRINKGRSLAIHSVGMLSRGAAVARGVARDGDESHRSSAGFLPIRSSLYPTARWFRISYADIYWSI